MTEQEKRILRYAKRTMAAQKNPYGSVEKVFPLAIDSLAADAETRYLGVKNTSAIPAEAFSRLSQAGFVLHTVDRMSFGGRAVDMGLRNPLTGRPMTGSSSGTAVNVFLHFNDLGLGTDGGGSVLAPAMSLNLYGFISPLFCADEMKKREKRSTDGISFFPSLGLIARKFAVLERGIEAMLTPGPEKAAEVFSPKVYRLKEDGLYEGETRLGPAVDSRAGRRELLRFLAEILPECDWLVSEEGPVDVEGLGDSVFGHFDTRTAGMQQKAGKGLLRVVNMAGASALCIPQKALGCGELWICRSEAGAVRRMLDGAADAWEYRDEMTDWYFGNLSQYLEGGAFAPQ